MGTEPTPARTTATGVERKLAAILSADVAGYSRLMGEDEVGTLRTLQAHREVTDALISQYHGRVVNTAGDSVLAEFASAVDAVQCAVEIQQALTARNADLSSNRKMEFRIGINVGDVVVEGEQLYGDGVNVAARLQGLADAGGIFISGTVYDQVENKLALDYEYLGEQTVKNIARPVRVWRIQFDGVVAVPPVGAALRGRPTSPSPGQPHRVAPTTFPNRRVSTAHRNWVVAAVAGLMLLGGGIVTVRYLFFPIPSTQHLAPSTQAQPALPLPDKPSIVVLPFDNMSQDPEQDYFSNGITEVLTSDLSRISSLFVIARNTAFTYKGKAANVQEIGKELGVRYVLEGSVQKAAEQVRIVAQLIDTTTGRHLWSQRYDRPLKDIFALQDEIVQKIVTTLKLQLALREQGFLVRKTTDNLQAYDYLLRGLEPYFRLTKEANSQARQMFEKAIELDPQYAAAYVSLGWTYFYEWFSQWSVDPQMLERAVELVQRAIALDDSLPQAHNLLGRIYLQKKRHEQALTEVERALALNPNDADGYMHLGLILTYAGQPQEGLMMTEKAMRLNPHYPVWYLDNLGWRYYWVGRYAEAIATFKRVLARSPNSPSVHLGLSAAYGASGREAEARTEGAEFLRLSPNFSLEVHRQRVPFKDPGALERHLDALRKAGLK